LRFRSHEPKLVSLDNRFLVGEVWVCLGNAPSDFGIKTVKGRGGASGFRIERFAATDSVGSDGLFDIGPASPSLPRGRTRGLGVRSLGAAQTPATHPFCHQPEPEPRQDAGHWRKREPEKVGQRTR
jgi:hypothetical protein